MLLPGTSLAQDHAAVEQIAAANAEITERIADSVKSLAQVQAWQQEIRTAQADLDATMRRIERRAAVYAQGQELSRALTEQLRRLPSPQSLAASRSEWDGLLVSTSDSNFRIERELHALADLDAATAARIAQAQPTPAPAQRSLAQASIHAGLAAQRDLLQRLDALQVAIIDELRATTKAEFGFEQSVEKARARLYSYLFWIPYPAGAHTIDGLAPALGWATSMAHWGAAGSGLAGAWARDRLWPAAALLAAVAILALRSRLRATLASLAPAAGTAERYRVVNAILALVLSLVLALPLPLAAGTVGHLLASAPAGEPFVLALGEALQTIGRLGFGLSALGWILGRGGVAAGHLGWDEAALGDVVRHLRQFAALFLPLMFIGMLSGLDHAPFAHRESLGRVAFGLAMLVFTVLLFRLFRSGGTLMRRHAAQRPRGWAVRLHGAWFWVLVAAPLTVAVLAGAGYFLAAGYFFGRIVITLFLAFAAALLYGMTTLWVKVQRQQPAAQLARESAAPPGTVGHASAHGDAARAQRRPDLAYLGEQARSLVDLLITVLLLTGLWWTWKDAVPALAWLGRYTLWTVHSLAGGQQVEQAVTLDRLFAALLVGAVIVIAVRKVGALLDVLLLQRLEVRVDATYAIKVMTRYALAGIGIAVVCGLLGLEWSDMQWLIAALGVGLGFGLQEIVANFVSGLIVLAERPVRIGDVVTVGGVTGTVRDIRARAITLVDGEYKEIIIPNKAFITERVVNWTLSDPVTRLLLTLGVAYGSDIAQVQRLILDELAAHGDVLSEPAPSVYFVSFGDSALNFEIRAFVDSFDKRLRVQHDINVSVERVLRENGIEFPFPQGDLQIRSSPGAPGAQPGS